MRIRSLSLLHKALFALLLILLPIFITSIYSYVTNRSLLEKYVIDDLTIMAEAYEGQVYMFLEMSKNRVQDFSTDGFVIQKVKEASKGRDVSAELGAHLKKNKLPLSKNFKRICVISSGGIVIASTEPGKTGMDISGEDFFRAGLTGPAIFERSALKEPELAVSAPIKDAETGAVLGVIATFTDLSDLTWVLSGEFNKSLGAISWSRGKHKTMEVYLVNRDRLMLTKSLFVKDAVLKQKVDSVPVKACLEEGKEAAGFYDDYRGVLVAGASMCLPRLKWTLLIEVDEDEVLAPAANIKRDIFIAGAFVAGAIVLLFIFFFKSVILRLQKLSLASKVIAAGDYNVKIPVSGDEIGALSESFNAMALEINNRSRLLKQSEERLRAIIDNSTAVIYMKDLEGRYVLVNRRFEEIFHLKKDEIAGRTDYDLFPLEIADDFSAHDKSVLSTGGPMEFEETALQDDGAHHYVSVKFPLADYSGAPFAVCGISTDITERKRMEEAIRESEEKYRTLITNIPDVTWTATSEGRVVFTSPNIERMLGFSPEDVYKDENIWYESIHPEDRERVIDAFSMLFKEKRPFEEEYRIRRKDGVWLWIFDRSSYAYEKNGVLYSDGVFSDITERKAAEEKIERLNRLYSVLSKINEAIVRLRDTDTLFREAVRIAVEDGNLRMAWIGLVEKETAFVKPVAFFGNAVEYLHNIKVGIYGKESTGPTGTAIRENRYVVCNDIESDPRMSLWRDAALRSGFRSSATFPIRLGGNVIGAVTLYAGEPFYFNEEEIKLLDSMAADVSFAVESIEHERVGRAAGEERRAIQKRYEELVNNLSVGVYRKVLVDEGPFGEGHFIEVNQALVEMFEAGSKEELLKQEVGSLYDDRIRHKKLNDKLMSEKIVRDEEVEMVTLNGRHIWVSISAVLRISNDGKLFVDGIMEDVTEKKKLEGQLMHSQKLEAVGQLAGGIAHDFNNILTALIGYGNLLLMKKGADDTVRNYTEHILTLSEKATNLTQGLLAFSRKQIINPQPIDVNELVRRVGKILNRLIGEDIELGVSVAEEPLVVKADSTQIEQVLMNLATNARDAMPKGGIFVLKTERVHLYKEFEEAHGYGKPGEYCLIMVADNGMGMAEEVRKKIFEPFFTTKEVGKGTGLGLSMVYGIIKQHDGYINVYSEPDNGTTFKIYLPLTDEKEQGMDYAPKAEFKGGTETILLAEDDEEVRKITRNMLEEFGYRVIEAVDGGDAVAKFIENKDRINLLVFDMIMPRKNGKEACEEIQRLAPGIKVLFMSGYASELIRLKGILDSRQAFITKPVSPSEFLKKVREVIEQ